MFLAIINDTYSEVKADYSIGGGPESELANQIKAVSKINFFNKVRSLSCGLI